MSKYAITLSGGGSRGAFQAGFLEVLDKEGLEIETITGTSVGAINGSAYLSTGVESMINLWGSISNRNSYITKWPLWYFQSWYKNGIYSPRGIKELISKSLDIENIYNSSTKFFGCATEVTEGRESMEFYFSNRDHSCLSNFQDYLLASASQPVFFPPVNIDGRLFFDGGMVENIPVKKAVEESGDDTKIIILALTSPQERDGQLKHKGENLITITGNTIEIFMERVRLASMRRGISKHWGSDKFTLITPDHIYADTFDVDSSKIDLMVEHGRTKAYGFIRNNLS